METRQSAHFSIQCVKGFVGQVYLLLPHRAFEVFVEWLNLECVKDIMKGKPQIIDFYGTQREDPFQQTEN